MNRNGWKDMSEKPLQIWKTPPIRELYGTLFSKRSIKILLQRSMISRCLHHGTGDISDTFSPWKNMPLFSASSGSTGSARSFSCCGRACNRNGPEPHPCFFHDRLFCGYYAQPQKQSFFQVYVLVSFHDCLFCGYYNQFLL